jgi:hypothetical protein
MRTKGLSIDEAIVLKKVLTIQKRHLIEKLHNTLIKDNLVAIFQNKIDEIVTTLIILDKKVNG